MAERLVFSKRALVILAVFSIFIFAFFLRTYFVFDNVFSFPMKYSGDDGIYHMRIVENELLGGHFPSRIYFDPYTNFPNGTYIHFGPLYDYLLAFIIYILSWGNPTQQSIDLIAPFYPPLMGALCVLAVFFIGRALWNNSIGIIAALLSSLSSNLIFRSLLGSADHHIAEALFSSLAVLSLIYLIKEKSYSFKWLLFSILTGISLGLYFLMWEGALLFLLVFYAFFILCFFHEYFSQKEANHILASGGIIFFIVLLMISPFLGHPDLISSPIYSLRHIASIGFGLFSFLILFLLQRIPFKRRILAVPWFILSVLALALLVFLAFPFLFNLLKDTFLAINTSFVPYSNVKELIGEMNPLSIQGAIDNFSGLFFFSLGGIIISLLNFIKKKKEIDLLLSVWFFSAIAFAGVFSIIGQTKYMYYLWIISSLLSALFIYQTFIFGWKGLRIGREAKENKKYILTGSVLAIFFLVFLLLYPFPFNLFSKYPSNLPRLIQMAMDSSKQIIEYSLSDYYSALQWLKENTPAPSLDYYSLYSEPKNGKYDYPSDSYGVLARWDFGHAIVYYGHRMAVSNPFQQGIGKRGKETIAGEGTFFLETDEKKAVSYLDQLKARYVITDFMYSEPNGYFKQAVEWVQGSLVGYTDDSSKFDNSMIARLHLLDGNSTQTKTKKLDIPGLTRFRLVYESERKSEDEKQDIRPVKIFEYVKGARITGRTFPNQKVKISAEVTTNQQRTFTYEQSLISSDGYFEFVVPYSSKKGTRLETRAGKYKLQIGNWSKEIEVSEMDVLEGKTIKAI